MVRLRSSSLDPSSKGIPSATSHRHQKLTTRFSLSRRDPVPADCILLLDCITHLTRKLKQPRVNLSEVAFRILQKKPDFYRSTVFKDLKSLTDAAEKFGMIVKGEEGNGLNWIELVGEGAEDNGVLA